MIDLVRGGVGLGFLLLLAWLFSSARSSVDWKMVGKGLLIQGVLAILILQGETLADVWSPLGWPKLMFSGLSRVFIKILDFTTEGAVFIFGDLAKTPDMEGSMGNFFAFQVLPIIIFFASLTSILYHYGILQWIVKKIAGIIQRMLGTSGAETLSVASNIFIGQTEAPLVVEPYVNRMTRSELLTIMTGGMATIAGSVMGAYVQILGDSYAEAQQVGIDVGRQMFAEHLLGASILAAPAAIIIAKILQPETQEPETRGYVDVEVERSSVNGIDAAAKGAYTGLKLAANVGAMLLAFLALLAMINYGLGTFSSLTGLNTYLSVDSLKLETIFGWILSPITFLIGVPWQDAHDLGALLGTKIALNEFVAYKELGSYLKEASLLPKSRTMATFALCGFANFGSIAIQIGGIGVLAPDRRSELASLGLKAVFAGTIANLMTATFAGMLL